MVDRLLFANEYADDQRLLNNSHWSTFYKLGLDHEGVACCVPAEYQSMRCIYILATHTDIEPFNPDPIISLVSSCKSNPQNGAINRF